MIRNTTITEKTGLPCISAIIDARRAALFGHVARFEGRLQLAVRCVSLWTSAYAFPRLCPGSDVAADLVTSGRLKLIAGLKLHYSKIANNNSNIDEVRPIYCLLIWPSRLCITIQVN